MRRESSSSLRLEYQPGLDGLRGAAVAAVFLYHAGVPGIPGGYLGVSTFFTLSGYLITSLLLAEYGRTGTIRLAAFWERRLRRLMPATVLTLALVMLLSAIFAHPHQMAYLRGDVLSTLAYGVNWWFIYTRRDYADLFAAPSPVQHFWSLAIEEQFYVVFPLLTWFVLWAARGSLRVYALVLSLLAAASVGWMFALLPTDVPAARLYYGTDTRAAELLGGAVLAIVLAKLPPGVSWRRRVVTNGLGAAGLVATAGAWATMHQLSPHLYAGGLAAYTMASMAVVAATVLPGGPIRSWMSLGPLRWLGRISYGVYVYHFPIFLFLTKELTGLPAPALFVLRVVVCLGIAGLSYRFVEAPIRAGTAIVGWRRYVAPLAAPAALAAALLAITPDPSQTAPAAPKPVQTAASGTTATPPRRWWEPGSLRVLVLGDSVADNIGQALGRWATANAGMAVIVESMPGCGLARGGHLADRDQRISAQPCANWLVTLRATVARLRPDLVVVHSGPWDFAHRQFPGWSSAKTIGDPEFDEWLRSEYRWIVEQVTADGARVAWVSALCMRAMAPDLRGTFDPHRVILLNRLLVELVATMAGKAEYFDLFAEVCPGGSFVNELHGVQAARPDGVHFVPAAADWVADWLGPRLFSFGTTRGPGGTSR